MESRPRSLSGKKNAFYVENKGTIRQEARIVVNLHISILLCTKTGKTKSVKNMRKKHNERSKPKSYRSQLKELLMAELEQFKQQAKEYYIGLAKKFICVFLYYLTEKP